MCHSRSKITRINFHRNKLTIVVVEDDDNDPRLQRDFVLSISLS